MIRFDVPGVGGSPRPVVPYPRDVHPGGRRRARPAGLRAGRSTCSGCPGAAASRSTSPSSTAAACRGWSSSGPGPGRSWCPANPRVLAKMLTPRRHRDPSTRAASPGRSTAARCAPIPSGPRRPCTRPPGSARARLLLPTGRELGLEQPAVPPADPAADADRRRGRRPDHPGGERPDHGAADPRRPAAPLRGRHIALVTEAHELAPVIEDCVGDHRTPTHHRGVPLTDHAAHRPTTAGAPPSVGRRRGASACPVEASAVPASRRPPAPESTGRPRRRRVASSGATTASLSCQQPSTFGSSRRQGTGWRDRRHVESPRLVPASPCSSAAERRGRDDSDRRPSPGPDAPLDLPWSVWVAAFAVSEFLVVHVQLQRDSHSLSAPTWRSSPACTCRARHPGRRPGRRGGPTCCCSAASSAQARVQPRADVLPGSLATTVFTVLSQATVLDRDLELGRRPGRRHGPTLTASPASSRSCGCRRARRASRAAPHARPVDRFALGVAAVGLLAATTAMQNPASLGLLALPSVLLIAAYRAYTRAREQQNNLRRCTRYPRCSTTATTHPPRSPTS